MKKILKKINTTEFVLKSTALNLFVLGIFFIVMSFFINDIMPYKESQDVWLFWTGIASLISGLANFFTKTKNKKD